MGVPESGKDDCSEIHSWEVRKDLASMKGAVTSMTRLEGKGSCGIMSFFSSGEAEAIGDKKHGSFSLGSNPKCLHQRLLSANLKWPLI